MGCTQTVSNRCIKEFADSMKTPTTPAKDDNQINYNIQMIKYKSVGPYMV